MEKIKLGFEILGSLTVAATLIAAMTSTKKDDSVVGKITKVVNSVLKFLPTIGINPSTRILEHEAAKKEEVQKEA